MLSIGTLAGAKESARGTRTRTPLNSLGFGDSLPGAGGDQPSAIEFTQLNVGVGITSFEIDFWGRLKYLKDAARARYLATVEAERAFRLSLIGQVAATYVTIRSGEERTALAQRSLIDRREGLRIATRRADAGVTSVVDQEQARLLLT